MLYYIIQKQHIVNGEVIHSPIGYTVNEDVWTTLTTAFESGMGAWLTENEEDLSSGTLHPSVYFDSNPDFNYITGNTDNIEGTGLTEITEL